MDDFTDAVRKLKGGKIIHPRNHFPLGKLDNNLLRNKIIPLNLIEQETHRVRNKALSINLLPMTLVKAPNAVGFLLDQIQRNDLSAEVVDGEIDARPL
jgi:hypothetical protein